MFDYFTRSFTHEIYFLDNCRAGFLSDAIQSLSKRAIAILEVSKQSL